MDIGSQGSEFDMCLKSVIYALLLIRHKPS